MFWQGKRKDERHEYLVENIRFGSEEGDGSPYAYAKRYEIRTRTRDNRICHPGWRARSDRHHSHHGVQAKDPRTLGCHRYRDQQSLRKVCILFGRKGRSGQSTVEFAIITAGLLAFVIGLGALWHALDSGLLVEHALVAASHHLVDVPAAFLADIFRF